MEIYKRYSIDIFFQATFLLLCISLSVYIVFKDNLETFKSVNSLNKFSKKVYGLSKTNHSSTEIKEIDFAIKKLNINCVEKTTS